MRVGAIGDHGCDIILEKLDGSRHPTYDFDLAGARDLLKIIGELPTDCRLNEVGGGDVWMGAEWVYRPIDIEAFRAGIKQRIDYNHAAFDELCDVLAAEPDYWIYFSV